MLHDGVRFYMQHHAVGDEGRIERREAVALNRRRVAEVTRHELGLLGHGIGQCAHRHATRQPTYGRQRLDETPVHEHDPRPLGRPDQMRS